MAATAVAFAIDPSRQRLDRLVQRHPQLGQVALLGLARCAAARPRPPSSPVARKMWIRSLVPPGLSASVEQGLPARGDHTGLLQQLALGAARGSSSATSSRPAGISHR